MVTALALVVPGSEFAELAGIPRAYRIISGPYAGVTFCAPRESQTPCGTNVRVRFCPDDQFAKEIAP